MANRIFVLAAVFVVLLVGGSLAVYNYDSSRDDLIAKGVRVAGIDVGGMRAAEARERVQAELADPLSRPLRIRAGRERFTLTASRARVTTDVGGMVADAVQASRQGDVITRTWRGLTGGEVKKDVQLRTNFDEAQVAALIRRVKRHVNREPKNATIQASAGGLDQVKSHTGVALQARSLERRISRALTSPAAPRAITARLNIVEPKISTDDLADAYPWYVVVNRSGFKLTVYDHLQVKKTYRVAVGQVGLETPAGLYHVQNKAVNPAWHVPNSDWAGELAGTVIPGGVPDNPIKARWLGIFDGAGIHGTDNVSSLGSAASHGCIRMAIPDVIEVYDSVPVGAPVYIA